MPPFSCFGATSSAETTGILGHSVNLPSTQCPVLLARQLVPDAPVATAMLHFGVKIVLSTPFRCCSWCWKDARQAIATAA